MKLFQEMLALVNRGKESSAHYARRAVCRAYRDRHEGRRALLANSLDDGHLDEMNTINVAVSQLNFSNIRFVSVTSGSSEMPQIYPPICSVDDPHVFDLIQLNVHQVISTRFHKTFSYFGNETTLHLSEA